MCRFGVIAYFGLYYGIFWWVLLIESQRYWWDHDGWIMVKESRDYKEIIHCNSVLLNPESACGTIFQVFFQFFPFIFNWFFLILAVISCVIVMWKAFWCQWHTWGNNKNVAQSSQFSQIGQKFENQFKYRDLN